MAFVLTGRVSCDAPGCTAEHHGVPVKLSGAVQSGGLVELTLDEELPPGWSWDRQDWKHRCSIHTTERAEMVARMKR